jgi:malate synthase
MTRTAEGITVLGQLKPGFSAILTPEALAFVAALHKEFSPTRENLLARRVERQKELDQGQLPEFSSQTAEIRNSKWRVCSAPPDLDDRRVEITGPVERKMMINALNSGANVFMADFEDSLSPTWANVIEGQINLQDAVRKKLSFVSPDGKSYKLHEEIATLVVRPRGWHLSERHVTVDGQPVSASLFDFGLYFFHNAHELLSRFSGPYFYLPKIENHLEARLWNDVFNFAQDKLTIERGTIRATVLLETILAAFEMDEILYELRDHASGLNAGRWDYMFSIIKKFSTRADLILPDRSQVTMFVPFMRSYCDLLVKTCHSRGAHAMGGMAAFIPSRRDAAVNAQAMAKVKEDKERETKAGFDGTWVAHPDLVPLAKEIFTQHLGSKPNQKDILREEVSVASNALIDVKIPGSTITLSGVTLNISVALQYIDSWLRGNGAAAINNLMEDAATAEISRAQLWQWMANRVVTDTGQAINRNLYEEIKSKELEKLTASGAGRFKDAAEILDNLVLCDHFPDFLTIPAYSYLEE